jgi:hypothetical protein
LKNSLTAKDAEAAKEEKNFTAKDAKDAEEGNSLTAKAAKAAKAAKNSIIKTRKDAKELRQSRYGRRHGYASSQNCHGKCGAGFDRKWFQGCYLYATFGAVPLRPSGLALVLIIVFFAVKLFFSLADWRPPR